MKGRRARGLALALAMVGGLIGSAAHALAPEGLITADSAIATEMKRSIVLRSVRMPERFGSLILEVDDDARRIDRQRKVSALTDADVWVIGLGDWSDLAWFESSPLYTRFAPGLRLADPAARFKSFQWQMGEGRRMDVHFVNLSNTEGMSTTCLAELVYALTHRVVAHRRVVDLSFLTARAQPVSAVRQDAGPSQGCD